MTKISIKDIEALIQRCEILSDNDQAFLQRIYSSGINKYTARLKAIGFSDIGNVLDAGCGFGQWSLALTELGNTVTAIDASKPRVTFISQAADLLGIDTLTTRQTTLDDTGLLDNSMDGIFCYGVIFLTPWKESLAELARILKPGGKLYVNANGFGWYKHLWYNKPNATTDYDPTEHAANVLLNTWNYANGQPIKPGYDILVEPGELQEELVRLGFENMQYGPEGTLLDPKAGKIDVSPFFQGEYLGDLGVYELMATLS